MTHTFAVGAIVLYIISAVRYLVAVSFTSRRKSRTAQYFFFAGFICHTLTLLEMSMNPATLFLENGSDYFFWVSWALGVSFILLRKRFEYPIFGAILIPTVAVFMGSSSYLLHKSASSVLAEDHGPFYDRALLTIIHAVPATIAVVCLTLATVVSIVFILLEKRLKGRGSNVLSISGPNLQSLDRLNTQLTLIGFVCITLVVLSGSLWAISMGMPVFTLDLSIISSLIVWILLGLIVHARISLQWSPKRTAQLTIFVMFIFFTSVILNAFENGSLTHSELLH